MRMKVLGAPHQDLCSIYIRTMKTNITQLGVLTGLAANTKHSHLSPNF